MKNVLTLVAVLLVVIGGFPTVGRVSIASPALIEAADCGRVVSFDPQVITTASQPLDVALGDLNGDGRPEMVVVIYSGGFGNAVSVFRNTSTSGSLSFAAGADFTIGTGPEGVAIGDLDGDGTTDIATANASSNTISALRNISTGGTISFAPTIELTGGHNPHRVMIGDIDGDGKLDIVATNNGGGSVSFSVFRNTSSVGAISFAPKVAPLGGFVGHRNSNVTPLNALCVPHFPSCAGFSPQIQCENHS